MKMFIKNIVAFMVCLFILLYAYCEVILAASVKYNGENTKQQIERSFCNAVAADYNCYFLGNSRIYRGINPDMFKGVKAYNFAHDNDSYNQMYYKLLFLEEKGREIDYLIIGTDYFQFFSYCNTRNYIYDRLLGIEYIQDYNTSIIDEIFSDIMYFWKTKRENAQFCIPYLKGEPAKGDIDYLKDNGQYVVYGKATDLDTIDRVYTVTEEQKKYFLKIIEYCKRKDMELYVIMPPVRDQELLSYTQEEIDSFNQMIDEALGERFQGHYLNCSNLPEFKHYSNYTDITHLNAEAADRFSVYLNERLKM